MANQKRIKGVTFNVMPTRGFGFVRGDDGVSRFMHFRNFRDPRDWDGMRDGLGVEYTPEDGPAAMDANGNIKHDGRKALDLRRLDR